MIFIAYTVRVLLRVAVTFVVLLLFARLTGKKEIGQATFFDFVTAIALGDIAAEKLSDPEIAFWPWFGATVLWFLMIIGLDILMVKNRRIAKVVEGEPTILMENGRILQDRLKANFLRVDELMAHLRKKNCFSPSEVEYAVYETDGTVSVQFKSQHRPVTAHDLQVPTPYEGVARELVVEGRVIRQNLKEVGLDEPWLLDRLAKLGHAGARGIFYATLDPDGTLYVDPYRDPDDNHPVEVKDYGPH